MEAGIPIRQQDAQQGTIQSFAFVIAASVSVLLCGVFVFSASLPPQKLCQAELDSRINPNEAHLGNLVRLPGIGITRAGAILAYRDNFNQNKEQRQAFRNCDDLQKIRGIGPKTAQNICKWLKFESDKANK